MSNHLTCFHYSAKKILRNVKHIGGFKVGRHVIKNIKFASDKIFITESENDLKDILDVRINHNGKKRLNLNDKKTIAVVFARYMMNLWSKKNNLIYTEVLNKCG